MILSTNMTKTREKYQKDEDELKAEIEKLKAEALEDVKKANEKIQLVQNEKDAIALEINALHKVQADQLE